MSKYQVPCPQCGKHLWVDDGMQGQQTNCPDCHHVFTVPVPPPLADLHGATLRLLTDPRSTHTVVRAYANLAAAGVSPDSSMAVVKRASTPSDVEIEARDTLKTIRSRLMIDLLLLPAWQRKEEGHGPE
jgi:hypothetical protein